jgi:hypothetical protein
MRHSYDVFFLSVKKRASMPSSYDLEGTQAGIDQQDNE